MVGVSVAVVLAGAGASRLVVKRPVLLPGLDRRLAKARGQICKKLCARGRVHRVGHKGAGLRRARNAPQHSSKFVNTF